MPYYDDNSNNKMNWTAHKILTTPTNIEPQITPGPRAPFWAGVGSIGFLALVGFVAGLAFGQGEILAGLAGAAILGVVAAILKLAFGRSGSGRSRAIRFGAIGAVVGFVATIAVAFIGIKFVVMDGIVIGAVAGGILGLIFRD